MKILKSIAILALSAAIFSFAACDFDDGWGNSGDSGSSSTTIDFVLEFDESAMTVGSAFGGKSYSNGDTANSFAGLSCSANDIPSGKKVKTWKIGPIEESTTMSRQYCELSGIDLTNDQLATLKKNDDGNYILPITYELRDSYTVTLNFDSDNAWCSSTSKKKIDSGVVSEDDLKSYDTTLYFKINHAAYEKQWTSEDGTKPYVYGYSTDGGTTVTKLIDVKNGYISYGTSLFQVEFDFEENAGKTIDFKFMTRPAKSFDITFPDTLSITRHCYATYSDESHLSDGSLNGSSTNSETNLKGKTEIITSGTKFYEGESFTIASADSSKTFDINNFTINGQILENYYSGTEIILYSPDGTNYELWTARDSLKISVTEESGIKMTYAQ